MEGAAMTQAEAHIELVREVAIMLGVPQQYALQRAREILAFIYAELKEPSEEMVDAARANDDAGNYNFRDEWRAMLAASPLTKGE